MIDVVVDQRPLGFADRLLDRMKLLGEVKARPSFVKHLDDAAQMTLGPLEPFDDIRVGVVNVIVRHKATYPPGGDVATRAFVPVGLLGSSETEPDLRILGA
jgi:hypothetical protein